MVIIFLGCFFFFKLKIWRLRGNWRQGFGKAAFLSFIFKVAEGPNRRICHFQSFLHCSINLLVMWSKITNYTFICIIQPLRPLHNRHLRIYQLFTPFFHAKFTVYSNFFCIMICAKTSSKLFNQFVMGELAHI